MTRPVHAPEVSIPDSLSAPNASTTAPAAWRGHGTVLVVDDEAAIRRLTGRMLTAFGFTAVEAASGEDAVKLLDSLGGAVVLVLLDLTMPGQGGMATLVELRKRSASLPVVVFSGYGEADLAGSPAAEHDVNFLQKPFTVADLSRAVRAAIKE